jgi:hypothetical protein
MGLNISGYGPVVSFYKHGDELQFPYRQEIS